MKAERIIAPNNIEKRGGRSRNAKDNRRNNEPFYPAKQTSIIEGIEMTREQFEAYPDKRYIDYLNELGLGERPQEPRLMTG